MTELEKWQAVNRSQNQEELAKLIIEFADERGMIQGRERKFDAFEMAAGLRMFMEGMAYANVLTREYGIRQQALYLKTSRKRL